MGQIIISGLKIFAYHGVNPEEKENGQFFVVDLCATLKLDKPCISDNVNDTVSYAAVIKTVKRIMAAGSDNLIERAAYRIAEAVMLEYDKIDSIDVTVKKPDAPISADFDYVAVSLSYKRSELFPDEDNEQAFAHNELQPEQITDNNLSPILSPITESVKDGAVYDEQPQAIAAAPEPDASMPHTAPTEDTTQVDEQQGSEDDEISGEDAFSYYKQGVSHPEADEDGFLRIVRRQSAEDDSVEAEKADGIEPDGDDFDEALAKNEQEDDTDGYTDAAPENDGYFDEPEHPAYKTGLDFVPVDTIFPPKKPVNGEHTESDSFV